MSESPRSRSDTPATADSGHGKIYINTPPSSNQNIASLCSQNNFTDELLIALEKTGKSLPEIASLILPFNEIDPPAIVVDGYEFYNDNDPSNMPEKSVRIRELLDASFEDITRANTRLEAVEDTQKRMRKELENSKKQRDLRVIEKKTAAARFKFLALTAKTRFGVTKSKARVNARKQPMDAEATSPDVIPSPTKGSGETIARKRTRHSESSDLHVEPGVQERKKARLSETKDLHTEQNDHGLKKMQYVKKESKQTKVKVEPGLESPNFPVAFDARRDLANSVEARNIVGARERTPRSDTIEGDQSCPASSEPFAAHLAISPALDSTPQLLLDRKVCTDPTSPIKFTSTELQLSNVYKEKEIMPKKSLKLCIKPDLNNKASFDKTAALVTNKKGHLLSNGIMATNDMGSEQLDNTKGPEERSVTESTYTSVHSLFDEVRMDMKGDAETDATLPLQFKSGELAEHPRRILERQDLSENTSNSNLDFITDNRISDAVTNDRDTVLHSSESANHTSSWGKERLSADLDDGGKNSEEAEFIDSSERTLTLESASNTLSDASINEHVVIVVEEDDVDNDHDDDKDENAQEEEDGNDDDNEEDEGEDEDKSEDEESEDGDESEYEDEGEF